MPRKISRLGGTTLRRSFITNAYSPGMVSLRGAEEAAVLGHHATVLDDADAGAGERRGGVVVPDAELKPHDGRPPGQPNDLGGVRLQVLGATKDLDDIWRLAQIGEHGDHRLAEDALTGMRGIHGQYAVAVRLEIRRHIERGLPRLALGAEHRDRARFAQDARETRVVVDEVRLPVHPKRQPLTGRKALQ